MNRSQEREQAFIVLFETIFHPDTTVGELFSLAEESDFFNTEIEAHAIDWSIQRITKVSLAVLRLALCEMMYFDDIPVSVTINEAVELAKKYAGKQDSKFINGVLGTIARERE